MRGFSDLILSLKLKFVVKVVVQFVSAEVSGTMWYLALSSRTSHAPWMIAEKRQHFERAKSLIVNEVNFRLESQG